MVVALALDFARAGKSIPRQNGADGDDAQAR